MRRGAGRSIPMKISRFAADESGAVTVDWVVLSAGIVGLGLATIAVASSGVENLTGDIRNALANMELAQQAAAAAAVEAFGFLHFAGQSEADQEVARVLSTLYGNDPQAYYNAIQNAITAFAQMNHAQGMAYEIDVLNSLQSYAAANGIALDTSNGMTLEQAHAAYAQLQG
jgi:hypothetical protein